MADALFQLLIENLTSLIKNELDLIRGVDKELNKLSNTLTTIQKVLEDAEDKQFENKSIQDWLSKLNGIAFEVEDILDECAAEASVSKQSRKGGKFDLKYKIVFKYKMGKKIKDAAEKLDELAADRDKFRLQEVVAVVGVRNQVDWRRETGSMVNEKDQICGRKKEQRKVVDVLVNMVKDCESLSVLPIIGVGGLGKTTLAQLVFNDEKVSGYFEVKLWVCVSDDFDLKAILKAVVETGTGETTNLENLENLQRRVREELEEKRFLLVLDDVWNENQEKWVKLRSILDCGSKGASVVVTTRMKKVADIMGTLPVHRLATLSEKKCWLLFKLRAFGQENDEYPNLEAVGRRIVKKCGGVPLAAKALGGLLRFKRDEKEWARVEGSQLWDLPEEENSILSVLKLSYRHLPFVLKRCFAYCALFPKDHVFYKEELIFHWMAHGCILSSGKEEVEDVGDQIWNELAVRSFFQEVRRKGRNTTFKMHDLVHDLARSIMENKIPGTESKHESTSSSGSKTRQVQWREIPKVSTSSIALEVSSLTTITNYPRLRTLKLKGAKVEELDTEIGKLKHLRHLDLTGSSIRTLPRTFCNLCSLQILILNKCPKLESLPEDIRYMTNLRHIFLEGCKSLSRMPSGIRELACLKTLSVFIVGDKVGNQLDELEHLNLGGTLELRHLERVQNDKNANLVEKPNLCDLSLRWEGDTSTNLTVMMDDEKILDALQPHPNLATLDIKGYRGRELAHWMKNITCLTRISISDCGNCTRLPPFEDLPLLKILKLSKFKALEYIVEKDDIRGQTSSGAKFPSLEDLVLKSLPNLKGVLKEEEEAGEMFPSLQKLSVEKCPLLRLTSTFVSSSLKNLKQMECCPFILSPISSKLENLTFLTLDFSKDGRTTERDNIPEDALQGLCSLKKLTVNHAKKHRLPENWSRDLNSLAQLELSRCKIGRCLPEGWLQHLTSLKQLNISQCSELVDFGKEFKRLRFLKKLSFQRVDDMMSLPQGLQHIPSLQSLCLHHLHRLTSLPDWLTNLASLTSLRIEDCPKIESLPSSIRRMTNLKNLEISGCPELERRCEKASGEDWPKIAHIPHLDISPSPPV